MDNIVKTIVDRFRGKIESGYYNSYCELMQIYADAMEYLQNADKRTFDIFRDWFAADGIELFGTVSDSIQNEKLDGRFDAFMEIYGSYLRDAAEEDCRQSVLDFLYIIPEKMKDDFEKFGFLEDEKQEYVWEYKAPAVPNNEYQYFWKPGNVCQVLLVGLGRRGNERTWFESGQCIFA